MEFKEKIDAIIDCYEKISELSQGLRLAEFSVDCTRRTKYCIQGFDIDIEGLARETGEKIIVEPFYDGKYNLVGIVYRNTMIMRLDKKS